MQSYLAILTLLSTISTADITIWEPASLRNIYKLKTLEYTIANFGTVPYGHSVYGTVFKATPLDACSDLSPLKWDKNLGTLILYVERGNCHFAQKVLMAQKIGAGMAIIGDTDNEDVSKILPVEKTVELMDKIHIPSILISKSDADNFRNLLVNQSDTHQMLIIAIHFPLVKSYNTSNMKMILQVDDFRSYDAILNLEKYYKAFRNNMSLTIHYKIFKNMPLVSETDNCVNTGNIYCVLSGHPLTKNLKLMDETVKQMCLFDRDYSSFMEYLLNARKSCFDSKGEITNNFTECMDKVYNSVVKTSIKDSIASCLDPKSQKAIELLESNDDNIKYYLINFSPIVFINGYIFKGNYDDDNHLMEAFCNSFEIAPSACTNLAIFKHYSDFSSYGLMKFIGLSYVIFWIIGISILAAFYVLYRRKLTANFDSELSVKINQAMAKYYNDKNDDYRGIKKDENE